MVSLSRFDNGPLWRKYSIGLNPTIRLAFLLPGIQTNSPR
jgi:hypothetical protein